MVDEHRKGDSRVGLHLLECSKEVGGTAELKSEIMDQSANTHKLLTLEALHIRRERPKINTRWIQEPGINTYIIVYVQHGWKLKKMTCQDQNYSQIQIL